MATLATVAIENGVYINPVGGCITVIKNGTVFREYLTPRDGQYVKYWHGRGNDCCGKQEFSAGKTSSSGWGSHALTWPTSDKTECARWMARRYRMKFFG